ncbi:MAG: hypothetical protein EZS28_030283, partial [Streblomastix strix]
MKLRMEILNKLSLVEHQRIKRGFGPQMSLTSFTEPQIQKKITEQNNNAIHIDMGWDFSIETSEQQDKFQEDFMDESQQLEIRQLDKNNKKLKCVGQSSWTIVQLDELFGTAREGSDQSSTELRSRRLTSRKQWIVSPTQTNPQSQTTAYPNQNQSSILNIDLMGIITNPFSVPKRMQHQQIAGEAAQVHHAPGETFSTNGNVRKVASFTDSLVLGQVG